MAPDALLRLATECPNPGEAFFEQWPGAAALVDDQGDIVAINDAWRATQPSQTTGGVGSNYLEECKAAADRGSADGARVGAALEDVIAGRRKRFRTIYSCRQTRRERWFELTIWPVRAKSFVGAAIVHEDVTEMHEVQRRTHALANADPLTGLANRRALASAIVELAGQKPNPGTGFFAVLDLDGFKAVNDRHGHDIGDRVLVITARRLRHAVRASDTVARIGGDEFALLLAGAGAEVTGRLDAAAAAIRKPIQLSSRSITVDVSYGSVPVMAGEASLSRLYREADQAMYRMKAEHRRAAGGERGTR